MNDERTRGRLLKQNVLKWVLRVFCECFNRDPLRFFSLLIHLFYSSILEQFFVPFHHQFSSTLYLLFSHCRYLLLSLHIICSFVSGRLHHSSCLFVYCLVAFFFFFFRLSNDKCILRANIGKNKNENVVWVRWVQCHYCCAVIVEPYYVESLGISNFFLSSLAFFFVRFTLSILFLFRIFSLRLLLCATLILVASFLTLRPIFPL